MLTDSERTRYQRQIMYPPLGEEGQNKLKAATVVVAGLGGLGSPASIYLACAGVGHLKLVDCDRVDLSNLNRQILYTEADIGSPKSLAAARKVRLMNPNIEVSAVSEPITEANVRDMIKGATAVVDGMDNFKTRLLLNRACVAEGVPFIHAGVYGLIGQFTTILPGRTPCLACIVPLRPRTGGPPPVLGVAPGMMASLQAAEAIKLIAGFGRLMAGRMLYINLESMEFRTMDISRRADCPVCCHT